MKTIQLSLQIADDITSIDQLEQYIDHLGQQIKRQLFTNMLTQLRQSKSQSDSTPSTCPSCKKNRDYRLGQPTSGLENGLRTGSFPPTTSEMPTVSAHI